MPPLLIGAPTVPFIPTTWINSSAKTTRSRSSSPSCQWRKRRSIIFCFHHLHLLPRCYQDRTNQPHSAPMSGASWFVVSCGVRLSEVGLSEIRKPQVGSPRFPRRLLKKTIQQGRSGPPLLFYGVAGMIPTARVQREPSNPFHLLLREWSRLPFTARKKGTWLLPSHPSEAARCASTGIVPVTPPLFQHPA